MVGELIDEIVIAYCEQEHIVLLLAVWKQANEERATRCKYIRDGNNNSFETSLVIRNFLPDSGFITSG